MRSIFLIIIVFLIIGVTCEPPDHDRVGGNIHLQEGRFDRAIELYKKAAKKYPVEVLPIVALSSAYYMKKEYKEAVHYLEKAIEMDKKGAEGGIKSYEGLLNTKYLKWQIYYNGAVKYFEEDIQKALGLAKQSLEVEDKEKISLSYSLMAKMMLNSKKLEEAKELYSKAMEADKNNIEPYLYLGHYYLSDNKSEDALKFFSKALEIDSTKIEIYELIGQAYLIDKKYGEAIKALEKAVAVSGKNPTALYNLMLAYYEGKDYDSAIKQGKNILAIENAEKIVLTKVYNLMGQVYKDKKDYKTAISVMKESIDKGVNDCFAYSIIAFSYDKLGNSSEFNKWAKKWEECDKNQ
jgi:tetratricopeptide (TPR) repeat protein